MHEYEKGFIEEFVSYFEEEEDDDMVVDVAGEDEDEH